MSEPATRRRGTSRFAIVTAVVLALAAAVLVPVSASAAPVALSGTVLTPSGAAAKSVAVSVLRDSDHSVAATTTTSSTGSFTFASLAPGQYTLKFAKTSTSFAQYLGGESDVDDAQVLELTDAGGNKRYVKVGLAPSGTLSGSVKKASGSAIPGYTVRAFDGPTLVATTKSSTSGAFSFTGLVPGHYVLQALASSGTPLYATTYSGGGSNLADADPVFVQGGLTTKYNFVLGSTAKVSGVVTGDHGTVTTEKLANVLVTPYREDDSGALEAFPSLARKTSSTGAFTLTGLPAGDYSLRFDAPRTAPLPASGTVYGAAFLGGWPSTSDATRFAVAAGASVTGKNIVLEGGHSIAGTLRQTAGGPVIPNALVRLYPIKVLVGPDYAVTPLVTHTDALGQFSFTGLRPEQYFVLTGSFTDSNPSDGIAEDTSWTRQAKNVDATAGSALSEVIQTFPRGLPAPTVPTGFPIVSAPDGLQVGDTLTVSHGDWYNGGPFALSYSYQWYSGDLEIDGATAPSYQLAPGDVETTVYVRVTAHDFGWGDGHTDAFAPGETQLGATLVPLEAPSLVGDAVVGKTVSIDTGRWNAPGWGPVDPSFEITWLAGPDAGSLVEIGDGPSRTLTGADFEHGGFLGWTAQASRWGFGDPSEWAGVVPLAEGSFVATTAPKVTKTSTALKVSTGVWSPTPSSVNVLWTIHEKNGTTETVPGTTLSLTSARKGKYISVSIEPVLAHVNATPVVLTAQTASSFTVTGSAAITGTPRVAEELTAPSLSWLPNPDSISYSWQYLSGTSWKTIVGATSQSYDVAPNYLGKKLRVVQKATKTGYPATSKISATVTIAAGFGPGNTLAPSTPSAPKVNVPLTVDPGGWTPTPTGFSYQWKYAATGDPAGPFTKIAGATSATFAPPASLAGKHLSVDVSTKLAGYSTATETAYAGPVAVGVLKNLTPPKATKSGNVYTRTSGADTWSPTPDDVDYEWFYNIGTGLVSVSSPDATSITDATTYQLVLKATAKKAGWVDGVKTTIVRAGTIDSDGPSVIAPMAGPYVDKPFTALVAGTHYPLTADLSSVAIQWQVEKTPGVWANISGATGGTFTPTGTTYLGKDLRYRVTRTAPGYLTSIEYSAAQEVQLGNPASPDAPLDYSWPLRTGDQTGLAPVTWDQPVTLTYRWDRSDDEFGLFTAIPGATGAKFTPKPSDLHKWIRLEVTAKRPGHQPLVLTLTPDQVDEGQLTATVNPKIVKTGNVLSVTSGSWNVPGAHITAYKWWVIEANGYSEAFTSTAPTLTLTSATAGKKILLDLTASAPNINNWGRTFLVQTGSKPVPVGTPFMHNPVEVGTTIWPDVTWTYDGPNQAFQWYRNGVKIPGETGPAYDIVASDLGKSISVTVTASAYGYASNTITVNGGPVFTNDLVTNVGDPTLQLVGGPGSVGHVDQPISATPGTWNLPGLSYAYQWHTAQGPIAGATSSTYLPRTSDIGREVWVSVTASKAFHFSTGTATSARTLVAWGLQPQLVNPGSFGLTRSGLTLKSTAITFNMPATVTYQWQQRPAGSSDPWTDIDGADSSSYTVGATSPAKEYRLQIVAKRDGHESNEYQSNAIVIEVTP